jgi:hypothetical protein
VFEVVLLGLAVAAILLLFLVWLLNAVIFYVVGRTYSRTSTTLTDALIVAFFGAIVNGALQWAFRWILLPMIPPVLLTAYAGIVSVVGAALLTLIVYVPLIMKFFDMPFGRALLVGLSAILLNILISGVILGLAS